MAFSDSAHRPAKSGDAASGRSSLQSTESQRPDQPLQHTRKTIWRALRDAETRGRRLERRLLAAQGPEPAAQSRPLRGIECGYFRLYSSHLFTLLDHPTDVRYGTLRFHCHPPCSQSAHDLERVSIELALGSSFYIADSEDMLPYHTFKMPQTPSLRNCGILSRRYEDAGAFPDYDSWLLFTFLGSGCLKLEIPVEMCGDIYGGALRGRENEEVCFWGQFVPDEPR